MFVVCFGVWLIVNGFSATIDNWPCLDSEDLLENRDDHLKAGKNVDNGIEY